MNRPVASPGFSGLDVCPRRRRLADTSRTSNQFSVLCGASSIVLIGSVARGEGGPGRPSQTPGFSCMNAVALEPGAGGFAHPLGGVPTFPAAARLPGSAGLACNAPVVLTPDQCHALLRQRLTQPLLNLFQELTGLPLHACWHEVAAAVPPDDLPRLCPRVNQRPAVKLQARCEACLRKRWLPSCDNSRGEKLFVGPCGSINYCARLKGLGLRLPTLLLQQPAPASRAGKQAFARAVGLARLILHDLEATLKAESGLRRDGHGAPAARTPPTRGNHRQHLVEAMLDYIQQHYARPMQLSDLARALDLNAAYVSDLFSRTVGVTFHHYLEELRLAKAKELLRDPRKRVAEVARAVGYTNPNHFRSVFSLRVGRPPSAWR
jgi:AraC-like DNA-binding protein